MSNNQMVSVPRELLRNFIDHAACLGRSPQWLKDKVALLNALAKPAEQIQGEQDSYPPCDYCGATPDHHPWHGSGLLNGAENRHIHACDGCRGKLPLHPEQHQGEPVAVLYADGHVLTKADCGDVFDICCKVETPLYTHAHPTEVERLRVERRKMDGALAACANERDELRAQLDDANTALNAIAKESLSASAEPSAPKCEDCNDTGYHSSQEPPFLEVVPCTSRGCRAALERKP